MYWVSKSIHRLGRFWTRLILFFIVLGPGMITMIADNDAGGISTYAVTGAKYGFNLLWAFFILVPMAYYIQEMTVRLGAVTKRGHAEAIFDGFGPFWGWFSIFDLSVINWLTLVTEYIGMTAAMSIFGIPPLDHLCRCHLYTFWGCALREVLDVREAYPLFLRLQFRIHPGCFLGHEDRDRPCLGGSVQGFL